MKERPIIFSGASVRSIIAGSKTQTRRIVTPQPGDNVTGLVGLGGNRWGHHYNNGHSERFPEGLVEHVNLRCRYGTAGDRLWVREAIRLEYDQAEDLHRVRYLADDAAVLTPDGALPTIEREKWKRHKDSDVWVGRTRSPQRMHRWASRLLLEVASVRAERLQEISEADAKAEGVIPIPSNGPHYIWARPDEWHVNEFATGWNELNKKRGFGWETNPWVFVVSFRRVE